MPFSDRLYGAVLSGKEAQLCTINLEVLSMTKPTAIKTRVTQKELQAVNLLAQIYGMNISETLRACIHAEAFRRGVWSVESNTPGGVDSKGITTNLLEKEDTPCT